ncbi:hypothetical protein AB4Y64_17705 [Lysobacter sp. TAF61]|uniref:hypothetical protein n=1 Tax=Lysobacter sp. TAF61 TaxID=3233072 RepID=UPI003F96AC28
MEEQPAAVLGSGCGARPNRSFKPNTNRYAIDVGLTQALGGLVRVISVLLFFLASVAHAQAIGVPREYWKESLTIAEAEKAAEAEQAAWLEKIESLDHVIDGDGRNAAIDSELRAKLIQSADAFGLRNKEQWQEIKAMYRPGDKIYRFAWPPLSGPTGYVLVRDDQQVHAAFIAEQ